MAFRDLGVGLLCGVLLGVYLGWALGPSRPWRARSSITACARAAPACRGACPPTQAPAPVNAAAVIEAQDEQLRALSELAFGRPLVWPDPELPTEVEASLAEALASCAPGIALVETDCSEP